MGRVVAAVEVVGSSVVAAGVVVVVVEVLCFRGVGVVEGKSSSKSSSGGDR